MKKTLIALGVAAAITGVARAAENSTTLYGALGYETQIGKNAVDTDWKGVKSSDDSSSDYLKFDKGHIWDLNTDTAKLGVKGNEVLGNGIEAFYKFEFGFTTNKKGGLNKTKKAYIGLKGDFGTLTLGRQSALYKDVTNYNDIYEDNWFGDLNHYGALTLGGTHSKAISYVTPSFSGFSAGIAGVLDGSHDVVDDGDEKGFNAAQAGIWYDQDGFYAGLAYSWTSTDIYTDFDGPNGSSINTGEGSDQIFGGAFGYSNDQFQVGLGVEHAASLGEKYNLAGQYVQDANTFRASVGMADSDDILGDDNVYTYGLCYQYDFSKRTYSWVEGQYTDWSSNDMDNGYTIKVGIRHNF